MRPFPPLTSNPGTDAEIGEVGLPVCTGRTVLLTSLQDTQGTQLARCPSGVCSKRMTQAQQWQHTRHQFLVACLFFLRFGPFRQKMNGLYQGSPPHFLQVRHAQEPRSISATGACEVSRLSGALPSVPAELGQLLWSGGAHFETNSHVADCGWVFF